MYLDSEPNPNISAKAAKLASQQISMAPFVFQASLCLRDFGILKTLLEHPDGLNFTELLNKIKLSHYSLGVLLDAGESCHLLSETNKKYFITAIGKLIETDPITRINMNFSQDVCYQGLFNLKEALETNKPAGLKVFGNWNTLYEGLSVLPQKVKQSWFEFDHFFSQDCFPRALPIIFKEKPKKILDVGGNTGKFTMACTQYNPDIQMAIADHPGQIAMAKENINKAGVADRVQYFPMDLLIKENALPGGFDIIWMSQFLSCFSADQIVMLLQKARKALPADGHLYIMETFTDNQKFSIARFCLDMTSLYFTAMANGNSRMYRLEHFKEYLKAAELEIVESHPHVRLNHSILKCKPMR
jgi:ubiquinone/menaquinone biosynthesis C-methylase UbiE